MKTNINVVAEKAGVSIATVSRTFNEQYLVKEETRSRIIRIAKELNYKPSPIARGLSTKTTDTIGVILPDLVGEFFMDIIHGIDEEAYKEYQKLKESVAEKKKSRKFWLYPAIAIIIAAAGIFGRKYAVAYAIYAKDFVLAAGCH